jgi:N6-L-threonylcarbamoyladenine synthase
MRILAIETSCDETSISLVEATGTLNNPYFKCLSHKVLSQIKIHQKYGGVYPTLAKREHAKNLIPVLDSVLKQAKIHETKKQETDWRKIEKILKREEGLFTNLKEYTESHGVPKIDLIAVTYGPGLEPALWVGINFAKSLSLIWQKPLLPINHMEGHIFSVLIKKEKRGVIQKSNKIDFPALAFLISGGHSELVLFNKWCSYKILGATRDDAVGESFDKVARMLGLKYPGGAEISKLAKIDRERRKDNNKFNLPRPMINSKDLDLSFSGLKTAVLYKLQKIKLTQRIKEEMSREFEDAVIDVLISKTRRALKKTKAQTLILGGGVVASPVIQKEFKQFIKTELKRTTLYMANKVLATDNALMIAIAAYFKYLTDKKKPKINPRIVANGNLTLSK